MTVEGEGGRRKGKRNYSTQKRKNFFIKYSNIVPFNYTNLNGPLHSELSYIHLYRK